MVEIEYKYGKKECNLKAILIMSGRCQFFPKYG